MQCDLTGKVCLVSGAARGIGQAIADKLSANGATVYYTDLEAAAAQAAAARFPQARGLAMNVIDREQIGRVVQEIVERHDHLDVLVNNAGINSLTHRVTIDEYPPDEWERIVRVDLTGVYEVSRIVAQQMRRQNAGRIVNIASIAGIVPLRLQCAYVAAKAGVVNLTRGMAAELGQYGILVNGIAPGSTLTEGTKQLFYGPEGKFSDRVQRMLDHVPLGRPGTTDEMAVAALFLAAPENTYMTGHVLVVDGGWIAGFHRDF